MNTTFRHVVLGQHFRFNNGSGFTRVCKKVSARQYIYAEPECYDVVGRLGSTRFIGPGRVKLVKGEVGTLNVRVETTERRSPVRKPSARRAG